MNYDGANPSGRIKAGLPGRLLQCCVLDSATGKRCSEWGLPDVGFDFFACVRHCNELADVIDELAKQESAPNEKP
jgi:hypothetical protein